MKRYFFFLPVIFLIAFLFFNCPVEKTKDDDNGGTTTPIDPFSGITKRDMVSITGGTYTQQSDENWDGDVLDPNESFSHTISNFQMAKYEVTYELWYKVHNWALSNGYTFANPGREGHDGVITDPAGAAPTTAKYEPVTTINWRDAMVWCNAYSQMAGLTPCYTYSSAVIKDSRNTNATACDGAVCSWSANGYRLPSEGEWQFTASNKGATPWNYGSGGTGAYTGINATDFPLFDPIAWYGNSTTSPNGNTTTTKDVGTKTANALLIFDMSGNVWELCWDWYGAYPGTSTDYKGPGTGSDRVIRGGCWTNNEDCLQVGVRIDSNPSGGSDYIGFRVARSK